jgi:hypothetical protein
MIPGELEVYFLELKKNTLHEAVGPMDDKAGSFSSQSQILYPDHQRPTHCVSFSLLKNVLEQIKISYRITDKSLQYNSR